MIFDFLALCIIVGCGLIIGNALLILLDREKCFDRTGDRAILAVWLGILLLANLFLAVSLFSPLSPPVSLCVITIAIIICLCLRQNRGFISKLIQVTRSNWFAALVPLVCVSIFGTQIVHWYDSGLYHIQVIKWLSEFGLVPGLALIHSRFGFVSSWFTLVAPFNSGIFEGRVFSLPGSFCLLILLFGWIIAFGRLLQRRGRRQDWFLLAATTLATPLIVLRWIAPSPSPDLPVMVLVIIVGWAIFTVSDAKRRSPEKPNKVRDASMVPLLLSLGAVTIKLSAFPLLPVSFVYYLCVRPCRLQVKKVSIAALVTLIALTPLAIAGVITSGCAFYPAPFFCTDLPWSLGHIQALTESRIITEWARWNGSTPTDAAPFAWIGPWLLADKVFTLLILMTIVSAGLVVAIWRERFPDRDGYIIAMVFLGIAFMFLKAPTWRFGLGYVFVVPALLTAILQKKREGAMKRSFAVMKNLAAFSLLGGMMVLYIIPSSLITRYSHRQIDKAQGEKPAGLGMNVFSSFLLPPKTWNMEYDLEKDTGEIITSPVVIIKERTADVTYYRSSDGEMCWDAPLPCAPEKLQDIRLRNPGLGLAGGFVRTGL